MVAFEVFRNSDRHCVAGVGDFGVLTACVTWVAHPPEKLDAWKTDGTPAQPTELTLHVGGLRSDQAGSGALHLRWPDVPLRVGDEIKIQVVEQSQVDVAMADRRDERSRDVEGKKAYVRRLARELGWEIREP